MDLRKRDRSADATATAAGSPNTGDRQKPKNDNTPENFNSTDAEMIDSNTNASRNLSGAFEDSDDPTWYTWNPLTRTWKLGTPPPATELWLDLPQRATDCLPYVTEEFHAESILAILARATEQWSLPNDDPYAFSNAWAAQLQNTRTRSNKKQKPFFQMACRLAVTPLQSLPNITPENSVPESPLVNAWIGSTKIFGLNADSPPPIFQSGEDIIKITPTGIKARKLPFFIPKTPFTTPEELFLEGNKGAHDACRSALVIIEDPTNPAQWEALFSQLSREKIRTTHDSKILALGLRLADTNPLFLPGWTNDQLPPSNLAYAWKGAQLAFGALWSPSTQEVKSPESTLALTSAVQTDTHPTSISVASTLQSPASLSISTTQNSSVSSVSFSVPSAIPTSLRKSSLKSSLQPPTPVLPSTSLKVTPSPSARLRQPSASDFFTRTRSAPEQSAKRLKKAPLTKTFMKLQVPMRVSDISEYFAQTTAAIQALHSSWKALMSVDSGHTTIEPWSPDCKIPSLSSSSTLPTSKARLEGKFLPEIKMAWSSWTESTTFRFILGHTKPISEYLENTSLLRKLDTLEVSLQKEKIQSSRRAIAGYLAGPLITGDTAEDLANILQLKAIFHLNGVTEVEIREDFITTQRGKAKKGVRRVRAMHVTVAEAVKAQARSCLGRQYPSIPRPDYPLGVQFRFVPNTADPDFAVPPRTRIIAEKLRFKQASFMDNLIERESLHFNNLHSSLESGPHIVLSKVLMSMKSKRFPTRHLFVSVEQAYDGAPVRFQYTSELATEADALIPVLPLALQGIYGGETEKWFKFSARIGVEGFSYDKANNRIVPTGINTFDELDQTWDQHAEGFREEDLWMDGDDDGDDEFGGFAIDLGIIDLDARDGRATILNDDSASIGTTRAPLPPGFKEDFVGIDHEVSNDDDSHMKDDTSVSSEVAAHGTNSLPQDSSAALIQRFLNDPSLLRQLQLAQQAQVPPVGTGPALLNPASASALPASYAAAAKSSSTTGGSLNEEAPKL
jgi:hypothetical protein